MVEVMQFHSTFLRTDRFIPRFKNSWCLREFWDVPQARGHVQDHLLVCITRLFYQTVWFMQLFNVYIQCLFFIFNSTFSASSFSLNCFETFAKQTAASAATLLATASEEGRHPLGHEPLHQNLGDQLPRQLNGVAQQALRQLVQLLLVQHPWPIPTEGLTGKKKKTGMNSWNKFDLIFSD